MPHRRKAEPTPSADALPIPRPPRPQPSWRGRTLVPGGLLAVLLIFAGTALAQDAGNGLAPTPAAAGSQVAGGTGGESVPSSAWLLPFDSLKEFEPVTITILLCSVLAVTLIVQAFLRVRRQVLLPEESAARIEDLIRRKQFKELIDFTDADDAFVSRALNPALKRAPSFSGMRDALESSVAEETAEQFRKLDYINILANVGPLLGLLGTVIGIMSAFLEMRRAGGSADVSQLAGGISTALGTTMLGLVLAIPCLVCYGILRNKADRLTQEGALLSEEFLLMIKPDGKADVPPMRPSSAAAAAASSSSSASRGVSSRSSSSRESRPSPVPRPRTPEVAAEEA